MNTKPIKQLIDPVFLGSAIYGQAEPDRTIKLSKTVNITSKSIETLNTVYNYSFTSDLYAEAFYSRSLSHKDSQC